MKELTRSEISSFSLGIVWKNFLSSLISVLDTEVESRIVRLVGTLNEKFKVKITCIFESIDNSGQLTLPSGFTGEKIDIHLGNFQHSIIIFFEDYNTECIELSFKDNEDDDASIVVPIGEILSDFMLDIYANWLLERKLPDNFIERIKSEGKYRL